MPAHRRKAREFRRRCQSCKRFGAPDVTITFDPPSHWWLCQDCFERLAKARVQARRSGKL